jgi:SOS-response transcriptional repressor LexA
MMRVEEVLQEYRAAEDAFLREYRFLPRLKEPADRLLRLIAGHLIQTGQSPTYRELLRDGNYSSLSVVAWHTNQLIRKGLLTRQPGKARSLRLTPAGETYLRRRRGASLFQKTGPGAATGVQP